MLSASTTNLSAKPAGQALVVGSDTCRTLPREVLTTLGYGVDERDDPYAAMLELCRRPLVYRAMVLSLQSLYRDELSLINAVRRRFPHVSIWLTHTDGRQSSLAEAMRLGAEAIVADDGVHAFGDAANAHVPPPIAKPLQFRPVPSQPHDPVADAKHPHNAADSYPQSNGTQPAACPPTEPVLTADELRALLGDDELS